MWCFIRTRSPWNSHPLGIVRQRYHFKFPNQYTCFGSLCNVTNQAHNEKFDLSKLGAALTSAMALLYCSSDDKTIRLDEKPALASTTNLYRHTSMTYDVKHVLGSGGFAEVKIGTHKKSDTKVAIKKMLKKTTSESQFRQEVDILRQVGGKHNIIELRDAFETADSWIIVTELAEGGELFDRLIDYGTYSEQDASRIIAEMCIALRFLHSKGIVHADLKPENIVLTSKNDAVRMKLVDFGLAFRVNDDISKHPSFADGSGTVAYAAPEVLKGMKGNCQMDVWALGVVLYILLAGVHPFDVHNDASDEEIKQRIIKGDYNFNQRVWRRVSKDVKDLISKLLVIDPEKRLSSEDVLNHPWISKSHCLSQRPLLHVQKKLAKFQNGAKSLNASITAMLMHESTRNSYDSRKGESWLDAYIDENCKKSIQQAISLLDPVKKGYIDSSDLKRVVKQLGGSISDDESKEMIFAADNDPDLEGEHIQYSDVARIVSGFEHKILMENDIIFKQGDPTRDLFILSEGKVKCSMDVKDSIGENETVISYRKPGNYFGEEMLANEPGSKRVYTARCAAPECHVLSLDFDNVMNVTRQYESLNRDLQAESRKYMHEALVTYMSKGINNTVTKCFKAGEKICLQGEACDKLFLIQSGDVQVTMKLNNGRDIVLERLRSNDFFQLGFFEQDDIQNATVTCLSPVKVIEVGGEQLIELMKDPKTRLLVNSLKLQPRKNLHKRALRALSRAVTRSLENIKS